MKKLFNKISIYSLAIVILLTCNTLKTISFTFTEDKPETALFLNPIELRKKQIADLNQFEKSFLQQSKDAKSNISKKIGLVNSQITETESLIKNSPMSEAEIYKKKLNKLKERKNKLQNLKESWNSAEEIIPEHKKTLEEIIENLQKESTNQEVKLVYSLKDLKEAQNSITELMHKINIENFKKEWILKQKKSEEDDIQSIQKEIDTKKKEQKRILEKNTTLKADDDSISAKNALHQAEIIDIDLNIANDRKENAEISTIKLDLEIKNKESEIKLLELRLEKLKIDLSIIQDRLYINKADLESMQEELTKERQAYLEVVNELNKEKEYKKFEKENYRLMVSLLLDEKKAKPDITKITDARSYLISSQTENAEHKALALEKELDLIESRKYLANDKINLKELDFKIVDILYKLQTQKFKKSHLEKWISNLSESSKKEEYAKKSLDEKRVDVSNSLTEAKLKLDRIQTAIDTIKKKKDSIFKGKEQIFQDSLNAYREAEQNISLQMSISQEIFLVNSELIKYKNDILSQYQFILSELETRKSFSIWKRSQVAISLDGLLKALDDAEEFVKEFFSYLPNLISPKAFITIVMQQTTFDFLGWIILICMFFLFLFTFKILSKIIYQKINCIKLPKNKFNIFIALISKSFSDLLVKYPNSIYVWLFILLDININFKKLIGSFGTFATYSDNNFLKICFYTFSIPFLLFLSFKFLSTLIKLNKDNNCIMIPRNIEPIYKVIIQTFLYSTVTLYPLKEAFSLFVDKSSRLPDLVETIYLIIISILIIIPIMLHKTKLVEIFSPQNNFLRKIVSFVSKNYYWSMLFLFLLMILFNPYIGYYNLAIMIGYAVPLTILTLHFIMFIHSFVRSSSVYWFIREEDDEVVDRFEHAKVYYGLFVILSLLSLLVISLIFMAKIWGVESPLESIWYLIQDKWTIDLGDGYKFGIIQVFVFGLFLASGYLVSTLLDKFVLIKFFDILRMEFGIRNTVSSISHYIIIYLVIVIGLTYINLGGFVKWVSAAAAVGIGFALKDLLMDLVCGFLVLIERPIEIGNYVEIDNVEGTVKKITPRTTTIKNGLQKSIIIPNRDVIGKAIINWTYSRTDIGFEIIVEISYENDPELVKKIILDILQSDSRILRSPNPILRVEDFGENGYKFLIRAFISVRRIKERWDIAAHIRSQILKEFKKHNIIIPYPQREIKILADYSKK
ncbi:MAG: hypothetical protein UR14_C0001G0058 [candidate division TM6 bacterium GW2011_GWE2_31_21]|nr:MAG: hypothetical protein UR14_C0001G0058 [candidate division TM6 bacterium GW2011_GWE2_31_21]KKP54062.1 MAG: hypothetical protein UR43_C0001G0080 [candidate division TM6 bacterium GW2011_GWF2_33_332]